MKTIPEIEQIPQTIGGLEIYIKSLKRLINSRNDLLVIAENRLSKMKESINKREWLDNSKP